MRLDNYFLKYDLDYSLPIYLHKNRSTTFFNNVTEILKEGYLFHEVPEVKFISLRYTGHGKCYYVETL